MRNSKKTKTLEAMFPLLAVEQGCIISKDAELTVVFEVTLPELFTISADDYDSLHQTWSKAIKGLPAYTVVHKQDWFVTDEYIVDFGKERTFLSEAYERHFNERPFLNHSCYLYITKTSKRKIAQQSIGSTLCRSTLIPREIGDSKLQNDFLDEVFQFEDIINSSGLISLRRLSDEEIVGEGSQPGLLDRYFSLTSGTDTTLEDIEIGASEMRVGSNWLCLHTLSDTDELPLSVNSNSRHERLSTDVSDCNLSYASKVGVLLPCNHIYNQYIMIEDVNDVVKRFEQRVRLLTSLSGYSRANELNLDWLTDFLDIHTATGETPVRAHFNVLAWADNKDDLHYVRNDVGSALAGMNCRPRHNTVDLATLYWAGIPGNAGDFPSEESFWTFLDPALCFFSGETNYRSSLSPFGIRLSDRNSGYPLHVDISDLPMKKGITTNRNKFILGPSGSGKSFFTNHMVRQYYEQGTHVLIVDTGHSYEGLCQLINKKTNGRDGVYFTYSEENPIKFNPFYTDDYNYTTEKIESLYTLIITLWKSTDESVTKLESTLVQEALRGYVEKIKSDRSIHPSFNTFYEYLKTDYRRVIEAKEEEILPTEFRLGNLLNTLSPYYKGGSYDFLLNSDEDVDLLDKAFVIFEIDSIKDNETLLPIVTIVIMEAFINKMRRLDGIRKMIIIEEAWKAIASPKMANFIKYLYKTVRKHFGEAVVVTQDPDDILQSEIVREAIVNNSDCKILLDQRKYARKFDEIQKALGLSDKEKEQILSINLDKDPNRKYMEVWIGLGGSQSAVYATEVSREEAFIYTTEQTEKLRVKEEMKKNGGDIEQAVLTLARRERLEKEN